MNIPFDPDRVPVIAGIGEVTERLPSGIVGREPLALMHDSIIAALRDAGASLPPIDAVDIVQQLSWPYRDLARLLAERLHMSSANVAVSAIGGDMPGRLLASTAERISNGEIQVGVVCGAESTRSRASASAAGVQPAWSDFDASARPLSGADFVSELALQYGAIRPADIYPFYENAARAAWDQTFDDAQRESALIGERMSAIAADNPYAWLQAATCANEIRVPSATNRMVVFPYTKLMIANPLVNMGSAVIVTSLSVARRAGLPEASIVYVGHGAGAHEPHDFLKRDRYDRSVAMDVVLKAAVAENGLRPAQLDLLELYSCFPIVPKLARRSLNIPPDMPLTVAGGLVFCGAPANSYIGHAITAMVRRLRGKAGKIGLIYGNGEFVTKHHALALSSAPLERNDAVRNLNLQPKTDAAYGDIPPLAQHYTGPTKLETYLVKYDRTGVPSDGIVLTQTPAGERQIAAVGGHDTDTLHFLVDGEHEPIGLTGETTLADDGRLHWKRYTA